MFPLCFHGGSDPGVFFLGVNMNPKGWLKADPEDALIAVLPLKRLQTDDARKNDHLTNAWEQADSTEEKWKMWTYSSLLVDIWHMVTQCLLHRNVFLKKILLSYGLSLYPGDMFQILLWGPLLWRTHQHCIDLKSQVQVAHWHPMKLSLCRSWKGLATIESHTTNDTKGKTM